MKTKRNKTNMICKYIANLICKLEILYKILVIKMTYSCNIYLFEDGLLFYIALFYIAPS